MFRLKTDFVYKQNERVNVLVASNAFNCSRHIIISQNTWIIESVTGEVATQVLICKQSIG